MNWVHSLLSPSQSVAVSTGSPFLEKVKNALSLYDCLITFQRHECTTMNQLWKLLKNIVDFNDWNRLFNQEKTWDCVENVSLSQKKWIESWLLHQATAKELCEIIWAVPDLHIVTPSIRTSQTRDLVWWDSYGDADIKVIDELNERCFDIKVTLSMTCC